MLRVDPRFLRSPKRDPSLPPPWPALRAGLQVRGLAQGRARGQAGLRGSYRFDQCEYMRPMQVVVAQSIGYGLDVRSQELDTVRTDPENSGVTQHDDFVSTLQHHLAHVAGGWNSLRFLAFLASDGVSHWLVFVHVNRNPWDIHGSEDPVRQSYDHMDCSRSRSSKPDNSGSRDHGRRCVSSRTGHREDCLSPSFFVNNSIIVGGERGVKMYFSGQGCV